MVRVAISPTDKLVEQKNFTALKEAVNGGLDLHNFHLSVLEGITAGEPDTEKQFNHSMKPQPHGWMLLVGDVYVQEISAKTVDVRSTKQNVAFKILMIAGQSLSSERVTNPDNYVDTVGVIGNNAGGGAAGPVIDCEISHGPFAGQVITQIVAIDGYFYFTLNTTSSVEPANYEQRIFRIEEATGNLTSLVLASSNNVCALFHSSADANTLWVADNANAGTISVHAVDTTLFTAAAPVLCVSAPAPNLNNGTIAALHVRGSYIYLGGSSGLAASDFVLKKNDKTTGANVSTFAFDGGNGTDPGVKQILFSDSYIYCTHTGNGPTQNVTILKIDNSAAAMALHSTITIPNSAGTQIQGAVLGPDGYIYAVGVPTADSCLGNDAYYLFKMDVDTDVPEKIRFTTANSILSLTAGGTNLKNKSIVMVGGVVYWALPWDSYTEVYAYDTSSQTITYGIIMAGYPSTTDNAAMQNVVMLDSNNDLILIKQGLSGSAFNFTWLKPLF